MGLELRVCMVGVLISVTDKPTADAAQIMMLRGDGVSGNLAQD